MNKKLISLLVAICLVIGLLPSVAIPRAYAEAAAGDPLPYTPKVRMWGAVNSAGVVNVYSHTDYTISTYENAVYTVNTEVEALDISGNTFTATVQTKTGADENNWNTKFVWHVGDDFPTLYIKDMIIDLYNETASSWMRKNATNAGIVDATGIWFQDITTTTADKAKLVIEGEDNKIEARMGVRYAIPLEIESGETDELTVNSKRSCISNNNTTGNALTINANLTLTQEEYSGSDFAVIANDGNITIDGGTISGESSAGVEIIHSKNGDVTINDGTITANALYTNGKSAIKAYGTLTVNNGTITASATKQPVFYGKTITIGGGTMTLTGLAPASSNCMGMSSTDGITINGGAVEIISTYKAFNAKPVLGTGVSMVVGDDAENTVEYTGSNWNNKYARITTESSTPTSEATSAPTTATSAPTTATTESTTATTAPTTATSAPTSATTSAPTTAPAGNALPYQPKVKIWNSATAAITQTLTNYGVALYTVNTDIEVLDMAGNTFTATVQTTTGASESNWNTKFVWNEGDDAPTLYIKDMTIDVYNETASKWLNKDQTAGTTTFAIRDCAGIEFQNISTTTADKAKLVIEGNNEIKTRMGVGFQIPLEVESSTADKLTVYSARSSFTPRAYEGNALTINANLDLTGGAVDTSGTTDFGVICNKGDIIINGGTINATAMANFGGIQTKCGGNITINGGTVTTDTPNGGYGIASFYGTDGGLTTKAGGKVTINNGTVTATSTSAAAIWGANGIEINGGTVAANATATSNNAVGMRTDTTNYPNSQVVINGGTVAITAYKAFVAEPVLGAGISMVVSSDGATWSDYNGTNWNSKYAKTGVGGGAPTSSTTAPTSATTAPTSATTAPTSATTPAGDALPYQAKVKIWNTATATKEYTLKYYDTAVYTVNTDIQALDMAGNTFTATVQTTTGADENNWNAKFVWNTGDDAPTMYIKDMVIDVYNEDSGKWLNLDQSAGTTAFAIRDCTGIQFDDISTTTADKVKLVIEGDDNVIKARMGIRYNVPLEIEGGNGDLLTTYTIRSSIANNMTPAALTINANLDLTGSDVAGETDFGVICAKADLTINGGTIIAESIGGIAGIQARNGGDVIINGGTITAGSLTSTGHGISTVYSKNYKDSDDNVVVPGKVIINGGTITAETKNTAAIFGANGVEINGGTVAVNTTTSSANAIGMRTDTTNYPESKVNFNGGTTVIRAYKAFVAAPVLTAGLNMFAGANASSATAEGSYTSKYAWIGAGEMPICNHASWTEANCTTPKTCTNCGETEGEALGHTGGTATCTNKPVCDVCHQGYGSALGHTGGTPSCQKGAICDVCDQEYGPLMICVPNADGTACAFCNTPIVIPNAGDPVPYTMQVSVAGIKQTLTHYEEAVYTRNIESEMYDTEGNKFTVTTQTTEGADENNWNTKYVWHVTDDAPTLYIKDMIIDEYNEDKSLWKANAQTGIDKTDSHTHALQFLNYADRIGEKAKLVIEGANNLFKCRWGISYYLPLEIESDDDAKLTIRTRNGGVSAMGHAGNPLTIDANLDIETQQYSSGYNDSAVIFNYNADITINGGNISAIPLAPAQVLGIACRDGGNVIINGGNIKAHSNVGTAQINGTIQANSGKIIINGGNLDITSKRAVCMWSKEGIEINGGIVNLSSSWYVINSNGNLTFNGGTTTMIGQKCIYDKGTVVAVIGEGMYAYAGAGPKSAKEFDGTSKKLGAKPWILITDDETKKIVDDDEELEDDILDPTEAPTDATDATGTDATAPTVAPDATDATDATVATTPGDGFGDYTEDEEYDDGYYDYGITPNLRTTEGINEEIPDALLEMGIDSPDMIRDILVEMIWAVDDYSDMFAFFDITLMYFDGEDWVPAGEEHYPEEGYITAMLPYPEGTGMDTPFTAVHMFDSDAFGMTPGDVELLAPINTEDGILIEMVGLSPVAIAWEGLAETEDNFQTGDTSIAMYVGLMVVALLGMATTVVLSNKKRKTY